MPAFKLKKRSSVTNVEPKTTPVEITEVMKENILKDGFKEVSKEDILNLDLKKRIYLKYVTNGEIQSGKLASIGGEKNNEELNTLSYNNNFSPIAVKLKDVKSAFIKYEKMKPMIEASDKEILDRLKIIYDGLEPEKKSSISKLWKEVKESKAKQIYKKNVRYFLNQMKIDRVNSPTTA